MTTERNQWMTDEATRKAVAHALWGVTDITPEWVHVSFAALRAALPDLVERDKWRAERAVAESLRTRVAELEAANRKLHARRFDVCDTLGLLARDENGEILNDPEPEDVIGAIEELQGRAERRAPLAASVDELTEKQMLDVLRRYHRDGSIQDIESWMSDMRDAVGLAFSFLARPAAAPSVAPASPAPGALSDEQVDECVEVMRQGFDECASDRDVVGRVLARAATFATAAPAAPVEASEAQPDYWTRVEIEHASRELARMESFREQDIGAAFRIAATFTAAARSAKGGSGQ
jgi:hypothetical protein